MKKKAIHGQVQPVVIGILILLLASCSAGITTPITMTITHVIYETSTWGCIGTNYETYLRSEDGKADRICGNWGKPGDKITGYWTERHWDSSQNGFHISR